MLIIEHNNFLVLVVTDKVKLIGEFLANVLIVQGEVGMLGYQVIVDTTHILFNCHYNNFYLPSILMTNCLINGNYITVIDAIIYIYIHSLIYVHIYA